MLRFSALVLTVVCTAAPVSAASWADGLFHELSKDFGSVPRGPTLHHAFTVKNNLTEPVRISSLRVSCGCTTATSAKSVLQPGEEGSVDIQMDTTRFTGLKSVTIYVQFDSPRSEEVRLWVRAIGRDDVSLNPTSFAFGQIRRGSSPSVALNLTLLGNNQYRITEISCESNYIQPSFKEVSRGALDASYQLTATLRADAPVGRWYTDVWVKTTNPTMERVRIPLTVEIESPLTVSPGVLNLGEVALGGVQERKVIVRGVKPFKVTRVEGVDELLSVKDSAPGSQEVHVLTVKLKGGKAGDLQRVLRVITDLEGDSEIEFRATANIQP